MTQRVFIPLTDELLYDHPELISGPLVPYVTGTPCYHWLSVELNPETDVPHRQSQRGWNRSARLSFSVEAARGTAHSL